MWREGKRGRLAWCSGVAGGGHRRLPPFQWPVLRKSPLPSYPPPGGSDGGLRSARRRDARCRPDGARGRMPAPRGLQAPEPRRRRPPISPSSMPDNPVALKELEPRRRRPPISPRGVPRIDHSSTAVQPPLFLGGAWRQGHGKPAETQVGGCHFSSSAGWCWGTRRLYGATWERRDVRPPRGTVVRPHWRTPPTAPSRNAGGMPCTAYQSATRRAGACGRADSGL